MSELPPKLPAPEPGALALRKLRHLEACLRPESQFQRSAGFETVPWAYRALPELDLEAVELHTTFLGKSLAAPVLIGAMTGGADKSAQMNLHLAAAAQKLGVGMMLGSQRVMLEHPQAAASFQVRSVAPDILLIGNLGAAQLLRGYGAAELTCCIELVGANALAVHLNPLQEAVQLGGDTRWAGISQRLMEVVAQVPYPLLIKEVGHGLDVSAARLAASAGAAALDVAGAGGTSWARVEELVAWGEVRRAPLCEVGIPTVQALKDVRAAVDLPLVASGGVRSGLDAAKALLLGAQVVAVARPLLESALESAAAVERWLSNFIQELRVALFVAGFESVAAVQAAGAQVSRPKKTR